MSRSCIFVTTVVVWSAKVQRCSFDGGLTVLPRCSSPLTAHPCPGYWHVSSLPPSHGPGLKTQHSNTRDSGGWGEKAEADGSLPRQQERSEQAVSQNLAITGWELYFGGCNLLVEYRRTFLVDFFLCSYFIFDFWKKYLDMGSIRSNPKCSIKCIE